MCSRDIPGSGTIGGRGRNMSKALQPNFQLGFCLAHMQISTVLHLNIYLLHL